MTPLPPFAIERYFAEHEFATPHLLCSSDLENPDRAARAGGVTADEEMLVSAGTTFRLGYTETHGLPAAARPSSPTCTRPSTPTRSSPSRAPARRSPASSPALVRARRSRGRDLARLPVAVRRRPGRRPPTSTTVELRSDDGPAIDLGGIQAALRPETRLIVVNAPHNPTGHAAVARDVAPPWPRSSPAYVGELVCDEVYRAAGARPGLLRLEPRRRRPLGATMSSRSACCRRATASQACASAGWRRGAAPSRAAAVRGPGNDRSMCNAAPAEILGVMALRARPGDPSTATARSCWTTRRWSTT